MAELVLGPMLRHVTETSATVWVETDRRCTVEVLGRTTPTFCVAGHHYALVDHRRPHAGVDQRVRRTARRRGRAGPSRAARCRPAGSAPCGDGPLVAVVFGSCRTAAPHEPPWALELAIDDRGRGVDALYAYALRMVDQPADEWPELAVFLGDQVYADDSSPQTRERIARSAARTSTVAGRPAAGAGRGFEEFTWLYEEAWSPDVERWFLSNVPSVMIFDDHDMIDDWNISAAWVRDIRRRTGGRTTSSAA